ncbi:MAG: nucleotide-binding protein [Rhodothermales bacterium]|nr:nucleotide-binding protein [Rhodothermales bacterium]
MPKPRVFLGSASESRAIVDALEAELRAVAVIERWDVDIFRPGHFTLEELTRAVNEVDFAIFVLGQDDVTESRGAVVPSPRDNVIFEAGLFTAILGRERTFYVVDRSGTKIPSDWSGLGYTTFDAAEQRPRDKVFEAVAKIRPQLEAWQPLRSLGALAAVVGPWWQFVINIDDGAVLSLMKIAATEPVDLRVEGRAWAADGTLRARYRSRSADYDEGSRTLYYYWEGEHPREQAIPRYFGVGEATFHLDAGAAAATRAEGWLSATSVSDVTDAFTKSTVYVRATPEELTIVEGGDHEERNALIQSKLTERQQF